MNTLDQNKQLILELFSSGERPYDISRRFNTNPQNITYRLHNWLAIKDLRQDPGNLRYFQNIDSNIKAYFLGFIAADGAIVKSGGSRSLTITIHEKDRVVLDILKQEIGNSHPIQILKRNNLVRFVISRKEFIQDLAQYNIGEAKSLTLPNFLKEIPAQYREAAVLGLFDGDGSICWRKFGAASYKHCISICATDAVIEGILNTLGPKSYNISHYASIPKLNISSFEDILSFIQLYSQSPLYLPRKYESFAALLRQVQTISSSRNKNLLLEFGARVPIIANMLKG